MNLKTYNEEDHPRDPVTGEWTDAGGGTSGSEDGGGGNGESGDSGGSYNEKGQWGEGPLLDVEPKTEVIEKGETKKGDKVALVYSSTPIPKPHPQGGFIVQYQRSYAVHIRKGHYDGKVPGGVRYSWFVHKQYLSKSDAEKVFAKRTKKSFAQVHYSTDKIFGPHGDLIRAKRDRHGDIVLYVDAIALDYDDTKQGIRAYLNCFKEWNEDDHPRDENGEWTDAGGGDGGGENAPGGWDGGGSTKNPGGQWTSTKGKMSKEDRRVIENYVDLGEAWNKDLRSGKELDAGDKKDVHHLDKIIASSSLKHDAVVFRGVGGTKLNAASFRKVVGKKISLKGYTSTTKLEKTASDFGKTILEVSVSKGSHAFDLTQWQGEQEVLLPRDIKVKVESVTGNRVKLSVM